MLQYTARCIFPKRLPLHWGIVMYTHRCALKLSQILNNKTVFLQCGCWRRQFHGRPTLKALCTFDNFVRPVFTLGVSQQRHKLITNLWKFELKWSSNLRVNMEEKKHPSLSQCAFRCLNSRPRNQILRSRNQIQICLSRKRRYFRGRRFLQCFTLSTALHWSLNM